MAEEKRGVEEGDNGQFGRDIEKYRAARSDLEKGAREDRGISAFLGVMGAISMAAVFIGPPGILVAITLLGGSFSLLAAAGGAAGSISKLRRAEGLKGAEELFRQADLRSIGDIADGRADHLRNYVEKSRDARRSKGLRSGDIVSGSSFLALAAGFGGAALAGVGGPFGMAALGFAALLGAAGGTSSLRDAARRGRGAREHRAEAGEALRGLPEGLVLHTRPGYPEDFLPYSVASHSVPPGGYVPADLRGAEAHDLSGRGGYVPEVETIGDQPVLGGYVSMQSEGSAVGGIDISAALPSGSTPPPQKGANVLGPATRLGRALEGVRERRPDSTAKNVRPAGGDGLRSQPPGDRRSGGTRGAR